MHTKNRSIREVGAMTVLMMLVLGGVLVAASPESAVEPTVAEAAEVDATEVALVESNGSIELAFVTHLDAELPEQDVYIERVPGSGEVFRVTLGDNDMSLPLYRTAEEVKHDPFNPAAVGPYPIGEPLGFTLGEWLAHRGVGSYTCEAGVGRMDAHFTGLVPNGVYTMWHAFMAMPPTDPFSGALELPFGARDGSESVFHADANGEARFDREFQPCLEMSDVHTTAMLAINYHSDGKTYKAYPGKFGLNAHIPLFVMLPNRDGME